MAGRFPGADSVSAFWDNLRRGEESIATLSAEALAAAGIGDDVLANPAYVRRAPILDGIDEFDADVFGFSPQAARMTDPQHRLFLQCAWHALEDAGCDPGRFDGSIGVYGTSSASGYLGYNLLLAPQPGHHHGPGRKHGPDQSVLPERQGLPGDAGIASVQPARPERSPSRPRARRPWSRCTWRARACSTGNAISPLPAVCRSAFPHHVGYWYEPGSIVSAAGHCRPFDVRADGTVFGSGVGIVVLKPLQAAVDDGDRIHAVIRGSAVNNDGSMKLGYAAPSAAAQADVIAEAHAVADIDSSTVSYVETHGTGTPLGDPIEIERTAKGIRCLRRATAGPVRARLGEVEHRSPRGGVGCRRSDQDHSVPEEPGDSRDAALHQPQPGTTSGAAARSPSQTEYGPWDADGVRRAGVSSFGVGGTNAHVVVEEAPPAPRTRDSDRARRCCCCRPAPTKGYSELRVRLGDRAGRPGRN